MGLGHMLIPAPIDYDGLSHNKEANDACRVDPFCEQIGSLRGLGDLINGGGTLDSPAAWDAWPKDLPLLMYHGGDDPVTDPKVAERFYQNVKAEDKKFELLKVGRGHGGTKNKATGKGMGG
jgi:acylglycerol lipase